MATSIQSTRAAPGGAFGATAAPRARFDLGTIMGLAVGLGLIGAAIAVTGTLGAFLNVPGLLIVFGGTTAVTVVSYSAGDLLRALRAVAGIVRYHASDPSAAAIQMLQLATLVRKHNVLAIEQLLPRFAREPFLHRALSMVVDGMTGDQIERVLARDLAGISSRHGRSIGVLRRAAEAAPAMGLIGTLVGLVQMLGSLQDPTSIGPTMAVALLTTFYGAVLAHVVFAPLASKLEQNSGNETLVKQIYLSGAGAMGRRENPRQLEMVLNAILPPAMRVKRFD